MVLMSYPVVQGGRTALGCASPAPRGSEAGIGYGVPLGGSWLCATGNPDEPPPGPVCDAGSSPARVRHQTHAARPSATATEGEG